MKQLMQLILVFTVAGGAEAQALASENSYQSQWASLQKALKSMDHAAKESFAASFDRKKKLGRTLFSELHSLLSGLPQESLTPSLSAANLCKDQPWFRSHQGFFELLGKGCSSTEPLASFRMREQGIEVEISLSSWRNKLKISPSSMGLRTQCSIQHRGESVHSIRCSQISLVSALGEELLLDELIYDQGATDVVSARGKLLGLRGESQTIELRAPARSKKIFVHLKKEIVAQAAQAEKPKAESEKEVEPKTEEEILAEMKRLEAQWDVWQIEKAVHGDPEAQVEEVARGEKVDGEYLAQDLSGPLPGTEVEGDPHADDLAEEGREVEESDEGEYYTQEELEDHYNEQRGQRLSEMQREGQAQEQETHVDYAEPMARARAYGHSR